MTLCCLNLKDYENSIKFSSEVIKMDEKNIKAYYRRGIANKSLNRVMASNPVG